MGSLLGNLFPASSSTFEESAELIQYACHQVIPSRDFRKHPTPVDSLTASLCPGSLVNYFETLT